MGLFTKKRKKHRYPYQHRPFHLPTVTTREYRIYKQHENKNLNWYEKLLKITNGMKMSFGKDSDAKLQSAINFTGLRATPDGIGGLMITTIIFFILLSVVFLVIGFQPVISLSVAVFGVVIAYYFYTYPQNYVKVMRIKAGSQVVLAILYMVVSMRISPNVERALRFAASNITGPLAWDMRRLLWDIEMRKYYSANEALDDYIIRWKPENEEFSESLRLIRDSQHQTQQRALTELDQALEVILEGTKTRMKHYAQDLLMPVMVIHMMGIVLPILGTIMAPLAAVFLSELVSPIHFIIGYDIILPIIIIWFINHTLNKRPMTLSQVDISRHPNLPKGNSVRIGKTSIPVLPLTIFILLLFWITPIIYFSANPHLIIPEYEYNTGKSLYQPVIALDNNPLYTLLMSSLIILGVGISLAMFYILSNIQKAKVQKNIENIEGEFELALFKLGNKISAGTPTELAIEKSLDDIKDLSISGLFKHTLRNIKTLGMTFESALFDKEWGAMRYYPSKIIENVMYAVIDTSKKGVTYASESMLRISRYLKNIRETQEYIRDLLTDTVSSMKFQAYFLTPLITGMIVAMADIIIQILVRMGEFMKDVGVGDTMNIDVSLLVIGAPSLTPAMFQLIIGVYLVEVIFILGLFLTRISYGDNKIIQSMTIGKMLIVGLVLYFMIAMITDSLFGDMILSALQNFNVVG